jgi:Flp pilus assembly protein TadD
MKFGTSALIATLALLSTAVPAHAESFQDLVSGSTAAALDGDWASGASYTRRLLSLDELSTAERAVGLSHLCMHLTNLKEFSAAAAACRQSVALEPTSWRVHLNRGNFQLASGDKEGAKLSYRKAQALNPKAPIALNVYVPSTYVIQGITEASAQIAEVPQ